jgi:hypothetical protein
MAASWLRAAGLIVVALLVGAGCDWRDFDAIAGRAPVVTLSAPPGYPAAQDFGQVMIAVSPPTDGSADGQALVSAQGQTGLAVVKFDAHGNAAATNVSGSIVDDLVGVPVWAMAELKRTRQALLGAPAGSKGTLALLDLDPPYTGTILVALTEAQFGAGVAAGALGGTGADDLVALSATTLHVFIDGSTAGATAYYTDTGTATQCPILLSDALPTRYRLNRPVRIANVDGTGTNQIIVGTPSPSAGGTVAIFDVDPLLGLATCALTLTAPGGEKQFGQSVAVGDFDGDGLQDLLVGAPPSHAYYFRGPVMTATPTSTITTTTGFAFGAAVAAVHVEGEKGDRAYIGDPDATVGGQTTAGNVSVYTAFSASGTPPPKMVMPTPAVSTLSDRTPTDSGAFGSTLAALPFCTTKTLPVDGGVDAAAPADAGARPDAGAPAACATVAVPLVGSATAVFGYFTLGAFDPRAN